MRPSLHFLVVGAGLLASAVAFAGQSHEVTIKMQKESFVPAKIDVAPGTRITWTNMDEVPHSVTAPDNGLDSGPILPGKSFQWTSSTAGTINYHCIFHPSMTAVVTVQSPAKSAHQP